MGLAKHKKLSKSEYNSLSNKDEDTLYAVNENGDFSEENLEDSAELYIGDKKITPTIVGTTGQSTTSVMHQKAVTDAINLKFDEIDSSKYLPLTGGTVTGEFKTNALTHLANSSSAVFQVFPQSEASGKYSTAIGYRAKASNQYSTAIGYRAEASGDYSTVIGYSSFNGRRSADTSKPYITMSYFRPLSITVGGADVYGVNIPKGESVSYIYNGIEHIAENTNTTFTAILVVIENTTKDILDVPLNYASIYNSTRNYSNMKILSITEISDNIFAVVLNGGGATLSDNLYRSYVALPIKTNSNQYTGQGGVNCGYSTDSTGKFSFTSGEQSFNGSSNSIINGRINYTGGSYISVFGQFNTVITPTYAFVAGNNNFSSASCFISGQRNLAVHSSTKILGNDNITTAQNQTIVGNYNNNNSNNLFIVANGTSNTNRKNIFEVSSTGVLYVFDNIIPNVENKDIGTTSKKWRNVYASNFKGNADTATKVNNALTIKNGDVTDTFDGSTAKTIDITDLQNIGNLENLQTSNKSNLVDAINEVNTKANQNSNGGTINDSTITPFDGFINLTDIVIENYTFVGSGGSVIYSMRNKMFLLTDGVKYYKDWSNYSLYNTSNSTDISARADKLFSFNNQHYMVINGTLQDISNIETTLKSSIDNAATFLQTYAASQAQNALNLAKNHSDNNLTTAKDYSDNRASQTLESANNYTDAQIATKILLVPELPENPVAGVLYCIPE